jgi:hypothetical protein
MLTRLRRIAVLFPDGLLGHRNASRYHFDGEAVVLSLACAFGEMPRTLHGACGARLVAPSAHHVRALCPGHLRPADAEQGRHRGDLRDLPERHQTQRCAERWCTGAVGRDDMRCDSETRLRYDVPRVRGAFRCSDQQLCGSASEHRAIPRCMGSRRGGRGPRRSPQKTNASDTPRLYHWSVLRPGLKFAPGGGVNPKA